MEFPKKYNVSSDSTMNSLIEYLENAKDGISAVCTLIGRTKNVLLEDFDISEDMDRHTYEAADDLIRRLGEIKNDLKRYESLVLWRRSYNKFLKGERPWFIFEAFNNGEERDEGTQ